jgi:hypothetical protein
MRLIILNFFLLIGNYIFSQTTFDASKVKLQIQACETNEPIHLDGELKESCWLKASIAGNFIQVEPNQDKPSNFRTEVKAVFNNKALYIAFVCHDTVGKNHYRAPDLKRDFDYLQNDMVAIGIDGFNDQRNSITFATNAYGAQKDYLAFDDTYFDSDWNGLWSVRTTRTDSCWIAEFELPWKTLRYKKPANDTLKMGLNLFRLRRNSNEISVWSPYPRSFGFNRMDYAGVLFGIKPPKPSSNVQFTPYTLVSNYKSKGDLFGNIKGSTIKAGGEFKWAVTPNLVVDGTVNTDFAQADADVQVNNLSRFSIFFPEKRQFFLENASLFGMGLSPIDDDGKGGNMILQPFFSRRIGLDDNGNPVPITGGSRLVYRSEKINFGGMYIHQKATDSLSAVDFAIARFSENLGKESHLGAMIISKLGEPDGSKPSHNNIVGGLDGFFRVSNTQSINFMVLQSSTSNTHQSGLSGYAQYLYTSNLINAWFTQSLVSKKFNAETGFLSANDIISTTPGFVFDIRKKWLPAFIRNYAPGLYMEWYSLASTGNLQERMIKVNPLYFNFTKGGHAGVSLIIEKQNITESFAPLGVTINTGIYQYHRQRIFAATDASQKLSFTGQYEWGRYYDGYLHTLDAFLLIAPDPFFSLKLLINSNELRKVGQDSISKQVNLYTIESRFALNPRVQLTAFYQKNSIGKQDSYNFRFSWEYHPLSYIYLIWNNRSFTTSSIQEERTAMFKISYLKQF